MIDVSIEPTRPAASKKKKKKQRKERVERGGYFALSAEYNDDGTTRAEKKGEAIELLACEANDHRMASILSLIVELRAENRLTRYTGTDNDKTDKEEEEEEEGERFSLSNFPPSRFSTDSELYAIDDRETSSVQSFQDPISPSLSLFFKQLARRKCFG